ncbi:MAG: hypothetical protein F6K47_33290 [Symploca sp. SIO2E6]|nr:hypothetical protein [Symploca sp. SIO2E6]
MVKNEFPIGQILTGVSIFEYQEFGGNELCLDQVKLFFDNQVVTLLPIVDTDEIEIINETTTAVPMAATPSWCQSFLGKELMTVWVCENNQGYRDQVILAFEYLHPSLIFVAEGSVIKVFCTEQVDRVQAAQAKLKYSQVS